PGVCVTCLIGEERAGPRGRVVASGAVLKESLHSDGRVGLAEVVVAQGGGAERGVRDTVRDELERVRAAGRVGVRVARGGVRGTAENRASQREHESDGRDANDCSHWAPPFAGRAGTRSEWKNMVLVLRAAI